MNPFRLVTACAVALLSIVSVSLRADVSAHSAVSTQPAMQWERGFLSGNGRMGAVWWGAPADETITVSHARLFLPLGTKALVPDLAAELPEVRRIIHDDGYPAAVRHMMEKARPQGYEGLMFTDPFHPGFEVKLKGPAVGPQGFLDYTRAEDFSTGEVVHRWRDERGGFERRMFVSRADNVVVLRIRPLALEDAPAADQVSFELSVPPIPAATVRAFSQNRGAPRGASQPGGAANELIQGTITSTREWITVENRYRESGPGNAGYDAALRVLAPGGRVESDGARLTIRDAREVLVLMRLEPFKHGEPAPLGTIKAALEALPADYDTLLAAHVKIHGELFGRVQLDLGGGADRALTTDELLSRAQREGTMSPALVEKLYDGSRYAILCAAGERPPNLQGIWSGTWEPAWSGDYTTNTNTQLAIAHLLSCGTPELLGGLFDLLEEFREDWRTNAQRFYGARGIMAPTRESTHGLMIHWSDRFDGQFWTCGAGWFAHWYWDYWLYTGDREFLEKKTVPWLEDVALFYEDFLFLDEADHFRFSPSNSAENGSGDNSTQDIMVAREVLTHLIAAYRELGYDRAAASAAKTLRWQAMLDKLPPYVVAENGELQEWALPGVPNKNNHRHMSHLYALFQSDEADPVATPELWLASQKAYLARLDTWFRNPENVGDRNNNETASHGRMHLGLCAARLGRGDDIWEILTRMAGHGAIYPSMASAHYEKGAIFNMDANGGIPEILNNALLHSRPGRIDLLPALPSALAGGGEIRGVRARGQVTINHLAWTADSVEVEMVSPREQRVVVILAPTGQTLEVKLAANQPASLRLSVRRP